MRAGCLALLLFTVACSGPSPVARLDLAGFNVLYPSVWTPGMTLYDSDVTERYFGVKSPGSDLHGEVLSLEEGALGSDSVRAGFYPTKIPAPTPR